MIVDAGKLEDLHFDMVIRMMMDLLGHAAFCGVSAVVCLHSNGQKVVQDLRGKC